MRLHIQLEGIFSISTAPEWGACWKLGPSLSRDLHDLTPLEHWTERNECKTDAKSLFLNCILEFCLWIESLSTKVSFEYVFYSAIVQRRFQNTTAAEHFVRSSNP